MGCLGDAVYSRALSEFDGYRVDASRESGTQGNGIAGEVAVGVMGLPKRRFLLLGIVYQGPVWVRAVVFIVYLFVAGMTVRVSRRYIRSFDDRTPQ